MLRLKRANPNILIVPRLTLSEMDLPRLIFLFSSPDLIFDQLALHLSSYDGIVLDLAGYFHPELMDSLSHFLHSLAFRLRE